MCVNVCMQLYPPVHDSVYLPGRQACDLIDCETAGPAGAGAAAEARSRHVSECEPAADSSLTEPYNVFREFSPPTAVAEDESEGAAAAAAEQGEGEETDCTCSASGDGRCQPAGDGGGS